jgi:Fe-S-cluster containining protein
VRASKLNFDLVSIEPGRFIVADSTVLLSTVNMVEEKGGVSYIGLDSGFNLFNHKFLYGIEPEIFNVSKISRENTNGYCVAGYLGESGDVFSQDKQLPETGLGDIIGIYPAGAYCASEMASFHMQQMPSQLFLEAEKNGFDIFPFCKACPRNCCYIGAVNVLPGEYRQIVERTGREDVFKPHNDYYIIDKKKGEPCPFLGRDGVTCTIQDIKPADCKVWPLYFDERGEPEHNLISPACPAHAFLPENYIQTLRNDLREIPENLREDYYNDTKLFGYQLEPLKNKL